MKTTDKIKPTVFAIFGGSGDLTWRKLMPSLFNLYLQKNMPEKFSIIILDRLDLKIEALRKHFLDGINTFSGHNKVTTKSWAAFAHNISYLQGDFKKPEIYNLLKEHCTKLEEDWHTQAQRIFYMATPSVMFGIIPVQLKNAGLSGDHKWTRIVVEKPIGADFESAETLNNTFTDCFMESQIFRIDHYLGKETVQNILAFRFANPMFEPIWNRRYVDYVTITVAEDIGVEHRGEYYDGAGALRDMIQNHLMQLLCLIAMEPMVSFDADEIRNKKVDVLHAVRHIPPDSISKYAIRGQYGKGHNGSKRVCSYREEEKISLHSNTETYAALKLFVDNWRWHDVPFYLRTGKRMPRQVSEVTIHFRAVPHKSFPLSAIPDWQTSCLVISIQPDEGIVLRFQAKKPGIRLLLKPVAMRFNYEESFSVPVPEAYETLLWDVMNNDATLFMRSDQVNAAWKIIMPVLDFWKANKAVDFPNYSAGTWGPESPEGFFNPGHMWSSPTELLEEIKPGKK